MKSKTFYEVVRLVGERPFFVKEFGRGLFILERNRKGEA
jgi:hypothetical protein